MFRGKYLPSFLQHTAPLYASLVSQYGTEKVYRVYDYFFAFMNRMQWGQWMVVDKVCPDVAMRQLFFWCVECIYQSDFFSQFCFEYHPLPHDKSCREVRIVCVEPTSEQIQRWQWFLPHDDNGNLLRRYSLIDWFSRLRSDPSCNPDIDPAWLLLEARSAWGDEVSEPIGEEPTCE